MNRTKGLTVIVLLGLAVLLVFPISPAQSCWDQWNACRTECDNLYLSTQDREACYILCDQNHNCYGGGSGSPSQYPDWCGFYCDVACWNSGYSVRIRINF